MSNQNKLLEKLEDSAEDIYIPESLKPEAVAEKLQNLKKRRRRAAIRRISAVAAAFVIVIGGAGALEISNHREGQELQDSSYEKIENQSYYSDTESGENNAKKAEASPVKKSSVGNQYVLASDYEDVYALFQDNAQEAAPNGIKNEAKKEADVIETDSMSSGEELLSDSVHDYSETNVMVEGVDESDIVKINDRYIYVKKESVIDIVDISTGKMELAGTLDPGLDSSDSIYEIYLDGDCLYFVNSYHDAEIHSEENLYNNRMDSFIGDYCYSLETGEKTVLQSYDVSDPEHPKKLGSTVQDGSYYTSRKVGDYIYLFSQKYVFNNDTKGAIPEVNEQKVNSDCIYIPEVTAYGFQELIVTSVHTQNPEQTVDQMVIINENCEIYMSENAIYLYSYDFTTEQEGTKVAKFFYKDGIMDAVNAIWIKGLVRDSFAVHESDGIFQILTTNWEDYSKNHLYLYDENLELLGSLENLALGEEIYAARYIGDMVYFVTYHNTDPLFAVDISDPKNPKAVGELEITGFSDYLHPYGENLLLGIGYETDPDTSEVLGVKLTMFDITNPADLKVLDTVVIEEANDTNAAYDYKSMLADPDKNLIGFSIKDWRGEEYGSYQVYQWKNGKFLKVLEQSMEINWMDNEIRGMYCGSFLYILNRNENGYTISQYNIPNGFRETDKMSLTL